jgi:hypothetical protein
MKTHMFVIDFARQFGVKEGLILTELCRRMYSSGENSIPFSVKAGKDFFPYMTEKQIRLALENLKNVGGIRTILGNRGQQTLDRTLRYRIPDTVYQYYVQIMTISQFSFPDSIEQNGGGN